MLSIKKLWNEKVLGKEWCDVCGWTKRPCSCDECYNLAMREIEVSDMAKYKEVQKLVTIESVQPVVAEQPDLVKTIEETMPKIGDWVKDTAAKMARLSDELEAGRKARAKKLMVPTLNGPVYLDIVWTWEVVSGAFDSNRPGVMLLNPATILDPINLAMLILHEGQHAKDFEDGRLNHTQHDYLFDSKTWMEVELPAYTNQFRWMSMSRPVEDLVVNFTIMGNAMMFDILGILPEKTMEGVIDICTSNADKAVDSLIEKTIDDLFKPLEILADVFHEFYTDEMDRNLTKFLEVTGIDDMLEKFFGDSVKEVWDGTVTND